MNDVIVNTEIETVTSIELPPTLSQLAKKLEQAIGKVDTIKAQREEFFAEEKALRSELSGEGLEPDDIMQKAKSLKAIRAKLDRQLDVLLELSDTIKAAKKNLEDAVFSISTNPLDSIQ